MNAFPTVYRPVGAINVAVGASDAAAASTVPAGVRVARLCSDVDCWVALNTAAVAGASVFLPQRQPEYIRVDPGDTVHVITNTAGTTGNLNIVLMDR